MALVAVKWRPFEASARSCVTFLPQLTWRFRRFSTPTTNLSNAAKAPGSLLNAGAGHRGQPVVAMWPPGKGYEIHAEILEFRADECQQRIEPKILF